MTTKISRVQIHEFHYEAQDIGFDAGGFDFVYVPGHRQTITKAAIVTQQTIPWTVDAGVEQRDFLIGEGATP